MQAVALEALAWGLRLWGVSQLGLWGLGVLASMLRHMNGPVMSWV